MAFTSIQSNGSEVTATKLIVIESIFIYLFIFDCVGSSFLCEGFLQLRRAGATLHAVCGPLTVAASLVAEHKLQTRRLSSCGARAQMLHGMWDLPRPGLEPVSPALAGRFSTTVPPGKPQLIVTESINHKFPTTVHCRDQYQELDFWQECLQVFFVFVFSLPQMLFWQHFS